VARAAGLASLPRVARQCVGGGSRAKRHGDKNETKNGCRCGYDRSR
jgi:hypothetical protein